MCSLIDSCILYGKCSCIIYHCMFLCNLIHACLSEQREGGFIFYCHAAGNILMNGDIAPALHDNDDNVCAHAYP